jgi:hypothetical protein
MRLPFGCRFIRPITDNIMADQLGDDVRLPYTLGWLGLLSVAVSMCGWAWTIYNYSTLWGTFGGGLTFAIAGMCFTLIVKFIVKIRRYIRARDNLLAEVSRRQGWNH